MALKIPDVGEIENTELNYRKLVEHIDEGVIQIPDFQREFVWSPQKILDLLDSINRGYPLGSLIFWVTGEEFLHSKTIGESPTRPSLYKTGFFVIDGQQRLKSLYAAARRKNLEGIKKEIDVLYDVENGKFVFRDDLSKTKFKRALYIPNFRKDKNVFFNVLTSIGEGTLEEYISKYGHKKVIIYDFIKSLEDLGLILVNQGEEILTNEGKIIVGEKNAVKMAEILAEKIEYMKDVLEIIRDNPGITRIKAVKEFKKVYGGSDATVNQQFGRRSRWLRSLGLVKKDIKNRPHPLFLTEKGKEILNVLEEIDKEEKTKYIPLEKILSDDSQVYKYIQDLPEDRSEKVIGIRDRFNKYNFSIIVVNKTDWEEVCEIFERINTAGQELNVVDLMIAKTWEKEGFNLREELEGFREEIEWDIPDATVLQTLSLNICGRCRRKDILGLKKSEVVENWEKTKECIRKAIDFVKKDLNIPLDLIPYPALLVPISHFYYILGNQEPTIEQKEKIERWFWKASVSNRFDSSVETSLERDGEIIKLLSENKPAEFKYSYPHRTAEDIIGQKYSLGSAFSKTILCLFINMNPVNPINNAEVKPDNTSRRLRSQLHHIFPKNYLRKQGVKDELINSIANIMFLPANINQSGEFKDSPKEYIESIENPKISEALRTHLIYDIENSGILDNDFNKFLEYRASQIMNKLGELTGEDVVISEGKTLSPETPFTNETHIREIIRHSKNYVDWIDLYFTRRGLEFLSIEADPKKVKRIRILTGTKQTDSGLRRDFKKLKEEMREKEIDIEMRVIIKEEAGEIHDRWILAENHLFNVPSVNTIGRGQYAEITQAASRPPFDEWWEKGLDIVENWNEIEKKL